MTLANSKALASAIDPKVRDYIDAKLKEEISPIRDDLSDLLCAISEVREMSQYDAGNLIGRINNMEQVLMMSSAKIARIRDLGKEDN